MGVFSWSSATSEYVASCSSASSGGTTWRRGIGGGGGTMGARGPVAGRGTVGGSVRGLDEDTAGLDEDTAGFDEGTAGFDEGTICREDGTAGFDEGGGCSREGPLGNPISTREKINVASESSLVGSLTMIGGWRFDETGFGSDCGIAGERFDDMGDSGSRRPGARFDCGWASASQTSRIACCISFADWNRSSGSFERALSTIRASSAGTFASTASAGVGTAVWICTRRAL